MKLPSKLIKGGLCSLLGWSILFTQTTAMSFGFGPSDIVGFISFASKVKTSLSDKDGAKAEYQEAELQCKTFLEIMDEIKAMDLSSLPKVSQDRIVDNSLHVHEFVETFKKQISKYENAMGKTTTRGMVGSAPRRIQWALDAADDLAKFRQNIVPLINIINLEISLSTFTLVSKITKTLITTLNSTSQSSALAAQEVEAPPIPNLLPYETNSNQAHNRRDIWRLEAHDGNDVIAAASFLAVIAETGQTAKSLCVAVKRNKERNRTLQRLEDEVQDMINILDSLVCLVDSELSTLALLKLPIERCGQLCSEFEKSLEIFNGKSKPGLRDWPKMGFKKGDIKEFIDLITGYKSTISVGIGSLTLHTSQVSHTALQAYIELVDDTEHKLEVNLERVDERMAHLAVGKSSCSRLTRQ